MSKHVTRLAAAIVVGVVPAWAAAAVLPAYATYSGAADVGVNFFSEAPVYTPLVDATSTPAATAQIDGSGYTASARTSLGGNHAHASASSMPGTVLSAGGFSGWHDRLTITGGTGTGTAHFTVHLSGSVNVGAYGGSAGYTLGTSTAHPGELASGHLASPGAPWPMAAVNPIASYLLGASPYNETSILFPETAYPTGPAGAGIEGIPSVPDASFSLGDDAGLGFPAPDLVLTPGTGQSVDVTLHGTLDFTYGESFYLIGGLGVTVFGDALTSFCAFDIDGTCTFPVKDGTGTTTLDLASNARLVSIGIPVGATATFGSGATYNVTAVPEPGEWLMLLAGLGLVGWRARLRT